MTRLSGIFVIVALLGVASVAEARFAENYAITHGAKPSVEFTEGKVADWQKALGDRLTDGRSTGNVEKTEYAVGWKAETAKDQPNFTIDLGTVRKDIVCFELDNIVTEDCLMPDTVLVEVGMDGEKFETVGKMTTADLPTPRVVRWALNEKTDSKTSAKFVRFTPQWKADAKGKVLFTEARVLASDKPYQLDGFFFQISFRGHWSQERFNKEMDWLHSAGLNTLMLCSGVTQDEAFYPISDNEFGMKVKNKKKNDPWDMALKSASERNMNMYMLVNEDGRYFMDKSPTFFKTLGEHTMWVFDDMMKKYGKYSAIKGIYLGIEFWYPATKEEFKVWVEQNLQPVTKHITEFNKDFKCVAAPFSGVETRHDAVGFRDSWDYMFANTPRLDMFQWQDGIGANEGDELSTGGRTFAYMQELFTLLKYVTDKNQRDLWVDAEFFDKVGGPYPPHFSRVRDQLASAKPFTKGAVGFEWAYLGPNSSVSAAGEFYQNYVRWQAGKPWIENIAMHCPYKSSLKFEDDNTTPVKKLTDNDRDGMNDGTRYVYWNNVKEPVELMIDLRRVRSDIEGYAVSVRKEARSNTVQPKVTAAVSMDGKDFTVIGELVPNCKDDEETNICQLVDQKPVNARYVRYTLTPVLTPAQKKDGVRLALSEAGVFSTVSDVVSLNKPYTLYPAPADRFPDETGKMTNGDKSMLWYAQCGWQNQKEPVEVVVDLTEKKDATQRVTSVQTTALRNEKHGTVLPKSVTFEVSADGKNWAKPAEMKPISFGDRQNTVYEFSFFEPIETRYIRYTFYAPEDKDGWMLISETQAMNTPKE